jgi:hypothetical protein
VAEKTMNRNSTLTFKIASEPEEFEQVHRLNYQTFVQEIPQHKANPEGRLVDRFHQQNTYLIGLCEGLVIGMMALRGKRPFSLDQKIEDLDSYLPPGRRIIEVRLLSVRQEHRNGPVLLGLLKLLAEHCIPQGYNLAIISGTVRQQKLYKHLGFVPFGPLVGPHHAQYQPMYLTLEIFEKQAKKFLSNPSLDNASTPLNNTARS